MRSIKRLSRRVYKMSKNVEDMSESELKKELKKLYKEVNDISDKSFEDMKFEGKMILKKKSESGEVVETRETNI